jgi:[acyl-carrier-protein] S-malonyltransferase
MSVALVFPGQGAQFVGMGQALLDAEPLARHVLREAGEASGLDLDRLIREGPADRLAETEITQPAILAVSAAVAAVLASRGVVPAATAGLSLGEYTALVAAGALDAGPAAALVRRRGRYMQEAVPLGEGAMAAVLGLEVAAVERLCAEVAAAMPVPAPDGGWVLAPANFNCPGQIVIAGHAAAVAEAAARGREFGARRVAVLPVSAPFHCSLMAPAAARLAPDLAALALRPAACPVVANVHARAVESPDEMRQALLAQVCSPVRWEDVVRTLAATGCDTFVEVGPGKTLSGFIQRILPAARVLAVCDPESLAAAVAACAHADGEG